MAGYLGDSRQGKYANGGPPRRRLDAASLPGVLKHQPSRRFLVEEGLPEEGADFRFTGLRAGRLEPFCAGEGDEAVIMGDRRLLVLGESYYWQAWLVLDGTTGGVHLVAWEKDLLRHDLIASGLSELAGLIGEIEAVSEAPRGLDPYGGRRGPAVVAEVRQQARERMRRLDPGLFAGGPQPAHWETSLLIRALHWGARLGVPDELAYVLDPGLIAETAEDGRVHRFAPEELPSGLTHEPTRRLLTEIGLPVNADIFALHDGPLRTMAEVHSALFDTPADEEGEEGKNPYTERGYQRNFIALGWWTLDLAMALDGATGRVELPDWYGEDGPAAYLHRDISALLYACWTYQQLRKEWERWDVGAGGKPGDWAVFTPQELLANRVEDLVEAVDPEAFATSGHSWRQLADDPHTGGLLG
ncbi:SUKH-4 family immunity protein [Streptomyces halobius]|uniref:SUKH-4 family immunity protein n=1 Tax=Streptomyces halobius TaxID=2879846 RepID=A0ABY4M3B0_9ACTN|nr:SUKH-4 family immunity protein [Streptomyces halobius]UQA90886.1 SUKH-4 family immunity protein [Streptomyces halobius]